MITKEYVREVLEQMCAPYMTVPLTDEFVDRIYDGFVKIRNDDAYRSWCGCVLDDEGNRVLVCREHQPEI
jgi:hypothetical protein